MKEEVQNKVTMTEPQFCEAVGISRVTAWRLRQRGLLVHYRIGRKVLYGSEHVQQFLKAFETK